jgi:hypothetical protein
MLIMFIRCKRSLVKTFFWEKKFIGLLSTVRGKDLMIGSSGIKPDLMLDRQTERRYIEVKEEEDQRVIAAQRDKAKAEEAAAAEAASNTSSMKFLSSIMVATAKNVKKTKSAKEMARELALFEKKLIFTRLTTPKTVVKDPNDPAFEYPFPLPFEGYSSVLDDVHRPGTASDVGFGRSPTRSPSPSEPFRPFTGKLRPISSRLYSPPPSPEPIVEVVVVEKKVKVKKEKVKRYDEDGDTISDDGSGKSLASGEGKKKKKKKRKKGKQGNNADPVHGADDGTDQQPKPKKTHGEKLLRDVLAPGERISRAQVARVAAETSNKVSRISQQAGGPKLTRRVEVQVLPPVRRGGGAVYENLPTPILKRVKRLNK